MRTIFDFLQDHINKIAGIQSNTDQMERIRTDLAESFDSLVEGVTKDIDQIKNDTAAAITTLDEKFGAGASSRDALDIQTDMNRIQHAHEEAINAISKKIDEMNKTVDEKLSDLVKYLKQLSDRVDELEHKASV